MRAGSHRSLAAAAPAGQHRVYLRDVLRRGLTEAYGGYSLVHGLLERGIGGISGPLSGMTMSKTRSAVPDGIRGASLGRDLSQVGCGQGS